ncbi:uncharacterized protein METZ01_LOCUS294955, partial [marine metagenome]
MFSNVRMAGSRDNSLSLKVGISSGVSPFENTCEKEDASFS